MSTAAQRSLQPVQRRDQQAGRRGSACHACRQAAERSAPMQPAAGVAGPGPQSRRTGAAAGAAADAARRPHGLPACS